MKSLPARYTVADVMTRHVHVASPQTAFKFLIRMLEENRISAIPIVDQNGVPVGIVLESDLLLKERRGELESDTGLRHFWRGGAERAKAQGLFASDLMTSPALTVKASTTLPAAARLMQQRNVRRLVVVDERGRIAGIVSRSDLLQVFLRTDEDIRREVLVNVLPVIVPDDAAGVAVDVIGNVITLSGVVDRRSDADILTRVTRAIDGVVDVVSRLAYRWDDTKPVARAL